MRTNIILTVTFLSFAIIALNSAGIERIGGTQLNGNGCVCHTTIESPNVQVWIEGPDTMIAGQSAIYKMYMFGGPAIAGGYNVAVRFGLLNRVDTFSVLIDNELTQNFPLPFSTANDTIFWEFLYIAPDSVDIDTIYSVGLSTNWDTIPDDRDQWAYGQKFTVRIEQNTIPIELILFNAKLVDTKVKLSWVTASEKNNRGFEVERKVFSQQSSGGKIEFEKIGFVEGKGTSSAKSFYSFFDGGKINAKAVYRLKQIDFDGNFTYSQEIEVEVNSTPQEFKLFQNYPNPFNPTTKIKFTVPSITPQQAQSDNHVTLKIYDLLGNQVAVLVDEYKSAGYYEIEFNAGNYLASGVYLINFKAGSYSNTKKMMLLR